jgi:hypothetical protein
MSNGTDRANEFTQHTGDVAGFAYGDGVKRADEASFLRTHGHAGPAIDASIPANVKNDGGFLIHIQIFL